MYVAEDGYSGDQKYSNLMVKIRNDIPWLLIMVPLYHHLINRSWICLFQERLDKTANPPPGKLPETFDEDFYEDQRDPMSRTRVIELNKVTKGFKYHEMALEKCLANRISRKQSTYGQSVSL